MFKFQFMTLVRILGSCLLFRLGDNEYNTRLKQSTSLYGANVIIFEGIFALYDKRVRDLMDLKIFVDSDAGKLIQICYKFISSFMPFTFINNIKFFMFCS